MDDSLRPVRLRKVVLGFYFNEEKGSAFHFDMSLNYKLAGIIHTYSENKPTLVVRKHSSLHEFILSNYFGLETELNLIAESRECQAQNGTL